MGFIYSKPLSIEGVFSKFDTDGNGKISRKEAKAAKNMDVFTNFKVEKGMTLETFESENLDVYTKYEHNMTLAYNQQQEKVKQWLEQQIDSMSRLQSEELKELEEVEKEVEKEHEEINKKLELQKVAKELGFPIPPSVLDKLSVEELTWIILLKKA